MEAKKKDVYRLCIETPGGACYYIYKETVARQLKEKLDREWGKEFKISLEKYTMDSLQ